MVPRCGGVSSAKWGEEILDEGPSFEGKRASEAFGLWTPFDADIRSRHGEEEFWVPAVFESLNLVKRKGSNQAVAHLSDGVKKLAAGFEIRPGDLKDGTVFRAVGEEVDMGSVFWVWCQRRVDLD